jgi:hypothetical protein
LPFDVSNDYDGSFITEEDDNVNSEVKSRRINIANAMWGSYLDYLANADSETGDSDGDLSNLDN